MSEEKVGYAVAVRDEVLFPTWGEMREQAAVLVKSKFFPKSIQTAEQALAVMMMGRELGIGTMESVRSIYPIEGKPTASAGLMAALILRRGASYIINESTNERCSITFARRNDDVMYTHEFTLEDAKRANLLGKDNWKKYPKAMLYNRCMSAGARAWMPNVIMNLYTPEELGAPVKIEGGDVVIDGEARVIEDAPGIVLGSATLGPDDETHDSDWHDPDVTREEPPIEVLPNGDTWIEQKAKRAHFWAWAGEQGLSHFEVHTALRVSTLKGWGKSLEDTKALVLAWRKAQLDAEDAERIGATADVEQGKLA